MKQVGLNVFDEQLHFIKVVFWYLLALDLLILQSTAVSAKLYDLGCLQYL